MNPKWNVCTSVLVQDRRKMLWALSTVHSTLTVFPCAFIYTTVFTFLFDVYNAHQDLMAQTGHESKNSNLFLNYKTLLTPALGFSTRTTNRGNSWRQLQWFSLEYEHEEFSRHWRDSGRWLIHLPGRTSYLERCLWGFSLHSLTHKRKAAHHIRWCTPHMASLFSPLPLSLFWKGGRSKEQQEQPWSFSFLRFVISAFFSPKLAGTASVRLLQWKFNRQSKRGGWHQWLKQKTLCLLVQDQANRAGLNLSYIYMLTYFIT